MEALIVAVDQVAPSGLTNWLNFAITVAEIALPKPSIEVVHAQIEKGRWASLRAHYNCHCRDMFVDWGGKHKMRCPDKICCFITFTWFICYSRKVKRKILCKSLKVVVFCYLCIESQWQIICRNIPLPLLWVPECTGVWSLLAVNSPLAALPRAVPSLLLP